MGILPADPDAVGAESLPASGGAHEYGRAVVTEDAQTVTSSCQLRHDRVTKCDWAASEPASTMRGMVPSTSSRPHRLDENLVDDDLRARFATLTNREFTSLREALAYHFSYVRPGITRALDDDSMPARLRRDDFATLHAAMGKLGIRMRSPLPAELE